MTTDSEPIANALLRSLLESSLLIDDLPEAPSLSRSHLALPNTIPALNLHQKLGHLYEDALAILLRESPTLDLLEENLQIRKDIHTTVGELDFLLREKSTAISSTSNSPPSSTSPSTPGRSHPPRTRCPRQLPPQTYPTPRSPTHSSFTLPESSPRNLSQRIHRNEATHLRLPLRSYPCRPIGEPRIHFPYLPTGPLAPPTRTLFLFPKETQFHLIQNTSGPSHLIFSPTSPSNLGSPMNQSIAAS